MENRKLSIIVPTYNCAEGLKKTLQSIFSQKNCSYECIVMDGKSTDGTVQVATAYKEKYPDLMKVFSDKDQGIYDAMNKGVTHASGEYIYFLGAGDTFISQTALSNIEGHHEDIVYGYVKTHDGEVHSELKEKMNFLSSFHYRPICHQAIFARKELLVQYPFELSYTYIADQAWMLRMYSLHKKFKYIDDAIIDYGFDGFSSSEKGRLAAVEEMDRAKRAYTPVQYFIYRLIKGKMRKE